MPRLLNIPLALLVMSAILYTSVVPASACSCATGSLGERISRSDLVFVGEVTAFGDRETSPPGALVTQTTILTVDRYFKGSGPAEQRVTDSAGGGASCGYFSHTADAIGQRHLIFAHTNETSPWMTSLCSGNVLLEASGNVTSEIDAVEAITGPGTAPEGVSPQVQSNDDEATKGTPWAVVLPLAFLIPLAVLLIPTFFRKRTPGH